MQTDPGMYNCVQLCLGIQLCLVSRHAFRDVLRTAASSTVSLGILVLCL